jgi:hypothetical protein
MSMKSSRLIALVILALSQIILCDDKPEWVKNFGKSTKFPEWSHLTGFGMAKVTKTDELADGMALAVDNARANLAQRIHIKIQNISTTHAAEIGNKYSEYFSTSTQSISNLDIEGLDVNRYYDDDQETYFALAVIERARLITANNQKADQLMASIRQCVEAGRRFEEIGQKSEALREYLNCSPLFQQLENARTVISVAASNTSAAAFEELENTSEREGLQATIVYESINRLVQKPMVSVDDVAWYLLYCLKNQVKEKEPKAIITPFTYRDTRLGSEFSRYFLKVLENHCVKETDWQLMDVKSQPKWKTESELSQSTSEDGVEYVLTGTLWDKGSDVKFLASMQRTTDGKIIASAEQTISDSIISKAGLSLKPENYQEAMVSQKYFAKDELVDGGLSLEVWTNKGTDNLLFTKGERISILTRVNLPCYLRFIYHLANGKRVVLLDNYYIDETKINKAYQIPEKFECTAPFGAEFLQAFASTERFERISTTELDGYDYLAEDLQDFLATTRGLKKANRGSFLTECRVVMTTVEN